jgi:putative membrane protein
VFLGVMAAGFVFGVITVSRAMAWLLAHQRSATLAFLIGLIFGSFFVLWPFKDYQAPTSDPQAAIAATDAAQSGQEGPANKQAKPKQKLSIRVATAPNRLPKSGTEVLWPGLMLLLGLGCASGLNKLGRTGTAEEDRTAEDGEESAEDDNDAASDESERDDEG